MTVYQGHEGWLVVFADAGGNEPPPFSGDGSNILTESDIQVRLWRMQRIRQMKELTPLGKSDAQFVPSHTSWRVYMEGFWAEGARAEDFNKLKVKIRLWRRSSGTFPDYIEGLGWFEHIEWIVDVGAAVSFRAIVRMSGGVDFIFGTP